MSRLTDERYWEDHPVRASFRGATWVLALVAFLLAGFAVFSIVWWGFGVGTASIRGRGNAYLQQQSADNRIAAQQHFEQLLADIKAADRKLTQADADVKANPATPTTRPTTTASSTSASTTWRSTTRTRTSTC